MMQCKLLCSRIVACATLFIGGNVALGESPVSQDSPVPSVSEFLDFKYIPEKKITPECQDPVGDEAKKACERMLGLFDYKAFSMLVPSDWEVLKDKYTGYALFMEPKNKAVATLENPLVADPNITVNVSFGKQYIDQQGLDEYAEKLAIGMVREAEGGIASGQDTAEKPNVYQRQLYPLQDGKQGLLFYFSYKKNGVEVACATIVAANEEVIFRTTLVDYKVSFDKNLEKLFPVMTSIRYQGTAPERPGGLNNFVIASLFFLVPLAAFFIARYIWARKTRKYKPDDEDDDNPKDDDDDDL